jgi:hypothetical protein
VLKKILKVVAANALIAGCFYGYVHLFALVVDQLRAVHRAEKILFPVHDSNSKRVSINYAIAALGPDHWSADPELAYRYYNAERGYWMYAKEWERIVEENGVRYDGKRMRLKPFALIAKSRDGKNTKTVTSDVAVIDLNEPLSFDLSPEGQALKVKHAHLEPNVLIRDDKSTPADPRDDLRIGPLTTVDYDDTSEKIKTQHDTHVIIQDPDILATGDGMVVQLRKDEGPRIGGASGFEGAERLDLLSNVHVVINDVGNSGILPGSTQPRGGVKRMSGATVQPGSGTGQDKPQEKPTPLDLRCDAKMQVHLPKPQPPVAVGPPAPPLPTVATFDRNVVVLRGEIDDRPDQLTCDNLRLDLVPAERRPSNRAPGRGDEPDQTAAASATVSTESGAGARATDQRDTDSGTLAEAPPPPAAGSSAPKAPQSAPEPRPDGDGEKKGLFGNLTLQRADATGHAVWLYLPKEGLKLLCNQLIHLRQAPYKPDTTYFRGDITRKMDLWKIDTVKEDGPDQGKVSSVTHIWAVDATLWDKGTGLDTADVLANGPGRLETQPDRDQPVERIAIWQDRLIVQNEVGPEGQLVRKVVHLLGNRPCFIDNVQDTSLDSARYIRVWLKPKPARRAPTDALASAPAARGGAGEGTAAAIASPGRGQTAPAAPGSHDEFQRGEAKSAGADLGGGNLQIERLLALRDVHLLAPSKTMTARQRLDAEFVEIPATSATSATPAKTDQPTSPPSANPEVAQAADLSRRQTQNPGLATEAKPGSGAPSEQVASGNQPEKQPAEPPMVGSAEQVWASIDLEPNPGQGTGAKKPTANAGNAPTAKTNTASTGRSSTETKAKIRKVWMFGNVALHQDPAEGERKGKEAYGEAFYLDDRGENKVTTYVYQRDPTEKAYLPGPLPPAWVEDEDKTIKAAGIIKMNQETDQVWTEGPGIFVQLPEEAPPAPAPEPGAVADSAEPSQPGTPDSRRRTLTTSLVTQNEATTDRAPPKDEASSATPPAPVARAGSKRGPSTIRFSERMEFIGRTTNPQGEPAGEADFYGTVTAQMPDALLYCEAKMIAYTDRVVPLAELGKMSKKQSKPKRGSESADGTDDSEGETEEKPKPQLALVQCYRNAIGITRSVDPDARVLLKKERIEAKEMLTYDRRTGDFSVPGEGKAYLFDRSDNSSRAPGMNLDGSAGGPSTAEPKPAQRTVTRASDRVPKRSSATADMAAAESLGAEPPPGPSESTGAKTREFPPLVLTQIHFKNGMRGVYVDEASGGAMKSRWSEFFGDVESARAKVRSDRIALDFDKLPGDAVFLTGQTLRVRSEPPPVGAPPSAAARDYMKAWEKAYAWSSDKAMEADVITYDSEKDQIYAFGEGGRNVIYAQQHATGQPSTRGSAKAVWLNPKTGELHFVDSDSIQLIDKNTGVRPVAAPPPGPDAKPKRPPKRPFRIPNNNLERRGFTGS